MRDWTVRLKLFVDGTYFWQQYTVKLWNPATGETNLIPEISPSDKTMLETWTVGDMSNNLYRSIYLNGGDKDDDKILVTILNKKGYIILDEIASATKKKRQIALSFSA